MEDASNTVPRISWLTLRFFRGIVRRYFRRHFHAVRISGIERFVHPGTPLIVYGNHSSWWDPMVSVLLAESLMKQRRHYAPMDASALQRYRILQRIGIFPIVMETARGAARFLRTGKAILNSGGVLWVTPQGRFADVRERPLGFKPGLAALASRMEGGCTLLPLAIEYAFWDERMPEALLRIGEPVYIAPEHHTGGNRAADTDMPRRIEEALLQTMEELKTLVVARDSRGFTTLRRGTAGTGGFYSLGERIVAKLQGRPYRAEHTAERAEHTAKRAEEAARRPGPVRQAAE